MSQEEEEKGLSTEQDMHEVISTRGRYLARAPDFLFEVTAVQKSLFWTSQQAGDEDGTRPPSSQSERPNGVKRSHQSP